MSTFDGFIREINWISIDRFEKVNANNCTTFFLSHCHTDHMNGIKNADFICALYRQKDNYLYCSEVTALILKNLGNSAIMEKVHTIRICTPTLISIPQMDCEGSPQEVMVTLLPAGHCPGSTMFLFETANENILYTGDFRINEKDFSKFKHLHYKDGRIKDLNCIYLDTTFWNQVNGLFPSRDESVQLIIHHIENWFREHRDGHVHIDRPGRIGSEHIIIALSRQFNMKIHVSKDSYNVYQGIYEVEQSITLVSSSSTKIHMCENFRPSANGRYLRCTPSYHPILYVRPTAQWYATGGEFRPMKFDKPKSFLQISLSMHASRTELVSFLRYFKPRNVFACVVPTNSSQEQIELELRAVLQDHSNEQLSCSSHSTSLYGVEMSQCFETTAEEDEVPAKL